MKRVISTLIAVTLVFTGITLTSHAEDTAATNKSSDVNIVTFEDAQSYFEDAVFIGDSVGLGFQKYVESNSNSVASKISFLTSGGFGVCNALKPVSDGIPHPEYNGQKQLIWDSIQQMGAKKVILSLGVNDMNPLNNRFVTKYKEVIDKILEVNPEVEITVVSVTPVLKGAESGRINNEFIDETNVKLQEMLKENGWGYIDVNSLLKDENGGLNKGFCSDKFVHLTRPAYSNAWETAFVNMVKDKLCDTNNVWIESMIAVIVTTESCDIYDIPKFRSETTVQAPANMEIIITGSTNNGFYRADLGKEKDYYIPKSKALIK